MKVVVQRVTRASCTVDNKITGSINKGFMLLVGFELADTKEIVSKVANKIKKLRIFDDENGLMNKNIDEVNGSILSISQFTLYGDLKKGNRPSFTQALNYKESEVLYDYFNECLRSLDLRVETGIFGGDMQIELINDGPITIILESDKL